MNKAMRAFMAEKAVCTAAALPLRDDIHEGLKSASEILAEVRLAAFAFAELRRQPDPRPKDLTPHWQISLDIMNRLTKAVLSDKDEE